MTEAMAAAAPEVHAKTGDASAPAASFQYHAPDILPVVIEPPAVQPLGVVKVTPVALTVTKAMGVSPAAIDAGIAGVSDVADAVFD